MIVSQCMNCTCKKCQAVVGKVFEYRCNSCKSYGLSDQFIVQDPKNNCSYSWTGIGYPLAEVINKDILRTRLTSKVHKQIIESKVEHNNKEQKSTIMNKLKNFSRSEFTSILLAAAATAFIGYGFYPKLTIALNYESYNRYSQECGIFLQRAGNAGTTGVAKEELAKAVDWLEGNYSTSTFEYKDLKGNLNYLKNQPDGLVVPVVIKESIKQNTNTINNEEFKKSDTSSFDFKDLFNWLICSIPIIALILLVIFAPDEKMLEDE